MSETFETYVTWKGIVRSDLKQNYKFCTCFACIHNNITHFITSREVQFVNISDKFFSNRDIIFSEHSCQPAQARHRFKNFVSISNLFFVLFYSRNLRKLFLFHKHISFDVWVVFIIRPTRRLILFCRDIRRFQKGREVTH